MIPRLRNACPGRSTEARRPRCRVGAGGLAMQKHSKFDQLGDEIALLSEPEVGALLMQALAAARETLYQRARGRDANVAVGQGNVSAETSPPSAAEQAAGL